MIPRCARSALWFGALLVAMWVLAASASAQAEGPLVSAHRGGAAYAPENTMVAFENASRLGADVLELDVVLSGDGELVVIHDSTLDRTTDCTGEVAARTVEQLGECDAAHWFTPGVATTVNDTTAEHPLRGSGIGIPTLADVLAWAATLDPVPQLFIESKNLPTEAGFDPTGTAIPSVLVPQIQGSGLADQVAILAFWPADLETVKMLDPSIRTHFLTTHEFGQTAFQNLAYVTARGHDMSGPNHQSPDLNEAYVEATHAAGVPTVPWTVDAAERMDEVIVLGVDGITTNYPACLLDRLGRPRPADVRPPELVAAGYGAVPVCGGDATGDADPPTDDDPQPRPDQDTLPGPEAPLPVSGGGGSAFALTAGLGVVVLSRRLRG
ncbi:MAG: hypothetical protein KY469_03935 [Actinobacteria bacterium]|nr:hypothetical protein [Actinomycetota bacterium]